MFFKDSRYAKVGQYMAKDSYGNKNLVLKIRPNPPPVENGNQSYMIKQGDRLDLLSYQYYGNPTKFWVISDANEEMYPDDLLRKGKKIVIGEEPF